MSKIHSRNPIDGGVIQSEGSCRCFSLDEVLKATYNFDDSLVIGSGGFGKVYKGFVDDRATMVAIKRLNAESKQGAGEFWMEVKMLSKINHANLVELIGYCHECDEMILVYEYIARGTLADHLYKLNTTKSNTSVSPLLWEQRLNICIGAARGLDHLHSGTSESIIHRDVKTTNILIDENWVAKISDFGLSKGTTSHSITHISTNVKGTFGYLDPDYFLTQRLTTKTDVYAFGVVLLEVLCGRPPVDRKLDEDKISLVNWAQQYIEKGKLEGIIDPSLIGQVPPRCLKSFVVIANNCLHKSPKLRPTMAEVLGKLELELLSQPRSRSEGVMTKVFQSMMERWLRERKDNSFSSGQSNDLPQGRQQINHTREPLEEGLVEITEEYTEETSAEEVSKADPTNASEADNINSLTEEEEFAKLMSKIDKVEKEELVEESDEDDDKDIINHTREPLESGSGSSAEGGNVRGTPTHGGHYVQYNVYGNLFEVSRKYVPPIRPVGRGSYGIGCAAVNSETREEVAIKKIGNAFDNRIDAKRTLREIKLLRHMDHENVIALKDIIQPPQKENFNDVYIVYELMDTDLHQIIRSNQPLNDDHCRYFLYQLLRGLKYVHSANVLHRDLKPRNLLLNLNCDLKIGDFGLARTTSETDFMTEYVVNRRYWAPELLLNCSEYTAAIDIWSVGCILGEIMTRQPLFPGKGYVHQLRLITELIGSPDDASLGFLRSDNARRYVRQLPQYPRQQFSSRFPNMSPGALDLLEKMLVFDPNRRITVDEALCNPYLAPFHDINEEPVCPRHFSFDFEQPSFTEENIKELIWRESVKFNQDRPIQ